MIFLSLISNVNRLILCMFAVPPHVGGWIEIWKSIDISKNHSVPPHVGGWIEIKI